METKLSNFLSDGLFKKIGREDKGNWRRFVPYSRILDRGNSFIGSSDRMQVESALG